MPFNGSGTFNRIYSWVTDAANGIKIRADRMDTDTNDIASGLSLCMTRDGQSVALADIPMGGFKFTGVGDATANDEFSSLSQVKALLAGQNLIINGNMAVAQINADAVVNATNNLYLVDRFAASIAGPGSKFSAGRTAGAVTMPVGASTYLGMTSLSAYALGVGEFQIVQQGIRGKNFAPLRWGTVDADPITISFLAYSSLTGNFGASVRNFDGSRSYPYTYSIPVANTWTEIEVHIAGDTAGTWKTDDNAGLFHSHSLGSGATFSGPAGAWAGANYVTANGAVKVVATNGATLYITNFKIERGVVKTPFVPDSYEVNLDKCLDYCYVWRASSTFSIVGSSFRSGVSGNAYTFLKFPSTLRSGNWAFAANGNFGFYNIDTGVNQNQTGGLSVIAAFGGGTNSNTEGTSLAVPVVGLAGDQNGVVVSYNDATANLVFNADY